MRTLELLSPAKNAETGRIAIMAGADAVYIGAPAFGARAAATNSVESIRSLAQLAHRYRARVYVTMNTILYDNELDEASRLVKQLYGACVDALIVQDMAYLGLDLPPIALHASTQCDIRTPDKASWLAKAGFSQLVLPREYSLAEIKAVADTVDVPVEVFVHGALCVSYSGDCQAGFAAMGRSANRGVCPQMCRLPYELVDADGNAVAPPKHYLSLRDLNRVNYLEALAEAGAASFKIEGRLKDARYVANVTAAYSRALDRIVERSGGKYRRSSAGTSTYGFTPDLDRTFNRGYTSYFLKGTPGKMASTDTPKWAGIPVGTISGELDKRRRSFRARLSAQLSNGDGLGFFNAAGTFVGFRLNRVEGNELWPASAPEGLTTGTTLYRNNDKAFFDLLERPDAGCYRKIRVDFTLRPVDNERIAISADDERGCSVCLVADSVYAAAKTPQEAHRRNIMAKLGDTDYTLGNVDDRLSERFIPASALTAARRDVLALLDKAAADTYAYDRRKACTLADDAFAGAKALDYHDNVANRLARRFYTGHGASIAEMAIETAPKKEDELVVMTTKYCLRRELGACLKEKNGTKLPRPLFLKNDSGLYRLDFDCARCGMSVVRLRNARNQNLE
ncbi:MAG: U32 family peptidase [Muribaculaceae bacterium]|nr:U32 family peptidase [Muribaculaceae bacterium]